MTGQAEEKRCFALAERLQKLIAAAGLCSRRTAEEWIAAGRVRVNGETATVGQSADPETDTICVDGVPVTPPERRVSSARAVKTPPEVEARRTASSFTQAA